MALNIQTCHHLELGDSNTKDAQGPLPSQAASGIPSCLAAAEEAPADSRGTSDTEQWTIRGKPEGVWSLKN